MAQIQLERDIPREVQPIYVLLVRLTSPDSPLFGLISLACALLQMTLPVGFERYTEKEYEEVNIPPSDTAPADIGRYLVPITIMDEVRRKVQCQAIHA